MHGQLARTAGLILGLVILLTLSPAEAIASTIAETSTPIATHLTLELPKVCAAKATTRAVAVLRDDKGSPLGGRLVRIERKSPNTGHLATGVTDSAGRFGVKIAPKSRTALRAYFAGDPDYLPSESPTATIAPRVRLSRPWTHDSLAYPGQQLPARGTLWPKHSAKSKSIVIVCERREHGKWIARKRYKARIVNTKTRSHYEAKIRFSSTGTWRVRALHADTAHARTLGPTTAVKVTKWRNRYMGKKIGGFRTKRKMVAITIDDGPNDRTLEICSILERYGAKGTFFFMDTLLRRKGYGAQAKKAYDRGHEIENHTINHQMLIGSYARSRRQANVPKHSILKAIGFLPTWIRAMGGGIDATGMRAVVSTNQLYCNWSVDSYDSHQRYTSPDTLYHNVVDHVRRGDVILIHQTHPESVKALPRICRELRRRGYKMVTLSRLAALSTRR